MLLVAYRELNDMPFSENEQKDLVHNWQAEYEQKDASEAEKNAAIKNWLALRNKVLTDESEPKIYELRKSENGYDYFLNCTAGAFENARKTSHQGLQPIPSIPILKTGYGRRPGFCQLFRNQDYACRSRRACTSLAEK